MHAYAFWFAAVAAATLVALARPTARASRPRSTAPPCAPCSRPAGCTTGGAGTRAGSRCCAGWTTRRSTCSSPRPRRRSRCSCCRDDPDRRPRERLAAPASGSRSRSPGSTRRGCSSRGTYLAVGWVGGRRRPADPGRGRRRAVRALPRRRGPLLGRRDDLRRPPPGPVAATFGFHEIFHLLVAAAAIVHFIAMAAWVVAVRRRVAGAPHPSRRGARPYPTGSIPPRRFSPVPRRLSACGPGRRARPRARRHREEDDGQARPHRSDDARARATAPPQRCSRSASPSRR